MTGSALLLGSSSGRLCLSADLVEEVEASDATPRGPGERSSASAVELRSFLDMLSLETEADELDEPGNELFFSDDGKAEGILVAAGTRNNASAIAPTFFDLEREIDDAVL